MPRNCCDSRSLASSSTSTILVRAIRPSAICTGFRPTRIKIDRSFISQVTGNPEIVGTILSLARTLNMGVEAEGIETVDQLNRLRELGCQWGQGYFFSRPVTSETASGLVGTRLAH